MDECKELAQAFPYPDVVVAVRCEEDALAIRALNFERVRMTIMLRVEIGKLLNQVAARLPHGQYGPWLRYQFPDWSEESTRRWRRLAHDLDIYVDSPKLLENLHKFESTKAAEEFPSLPEPVQQQVVEAKAWTWGKFQAVCWQAAMTERLEDGGLDRDNRYGHVRHAIDEVMHDPHSPEPLKKAAQEMYEMHRDTFAQLEGESPEVVDVEVGIQWKEPTGKPTAQLVEGDEGYWLCRRITVNGRDEFLPVAPVGSHVLLWDGEAQPSVLAAFPRTSDGPAAASWQRAGVRALCERLGASTLARMYGEAL